MTLRRLLPPLLCLLLLTGCAAPEEDGPLSNTPPAAGEAADRVTLYTYDEETVTARQVADRETGEAVAAALAAVSAPQSEEWTADRTELPVYAVELRGEDNQIIRGAWSGGYWVTEEGTAFRFDLDFSALETTYAWREAKTYPSVTALPCARALFCCRDGWRGDLLTPAGPLTPAEGIAMAVTALEDGQLCAVLRNETGEGYTYGESLSLHVLLDGVWRDVPPRSDLLFNLIGRPLPAGAERDVRFDIGFHYGDLPAGHYRVVICDDIAGEFDI